MAQYRAPIDDYRFIFERLLPNELRATLGGDDLDDELLFAILDEAARFAEDRLATLYRSGDQQGCTLDQNQVTTPDGWREVFADFRAAGWTALALPEAIGGQGLPRWLATPVTEFWQGANLAFSMFQPLTEGALEALEASGDKALIERYGPALAAGEMTATMALTEAGAGSDLGLLKTRAEADGNGGYRLSGNKQFITFGSHDFCDRILHLVLARLPDAPAGSKGISLFAVPSHLDDGQSNHVLCTGIEEKLGLHGSPTCSLSFEGAQAQLVGTAGKGLAIMFVMMNEARLSVGLQGVAVAERAYQTALEWAQERRQGRHPVSGESACAIIEHPDVRRLLLRQRAQTLASRFLASHLALRLDQSRCKDHPERDWAQREVELLTPVFKAYSTEVANRLVGDAIQVLGGMGFIEETGVAQCYRDLRVSTIYEGTTAIQAQDFLLRKVIADGGETMFHWLQQVDQQAPALLEKTEAVRQLVQRALADNSDTTWRLAGSVALLEAVGILASAWQLNRALACAEDNQYGQNLAAVWAFYQSHFVVDIDAQLRRAERAADGLDYRFG
ncbi:acyl-CoA dehydrogenase family protein [Saccharospirillum sp. HFRX-1]|uniref:acyl-CoA dehydrogenase family protein n=1 Tax=unclassified Saccharospirillum TaxID=2633430 RepID=UPI003714B516